MFQFGKDMIMTSKILVVGTLLAAGCTQIPYGGEVDFSDTGATTCVAADGRVLTGTDSNTVRCTPQTQSVSQ